MRGFQQKDRDGSLLQLRFTISDTASRQGAPGGVAQRRDTS